jgi:hypothetical protein
VDKIFGFGLMRELRVITPATAAMRVNGSKKREDRQRHKMQFSTVKPFF